MNQQMCESMCQNSESDFGMSDEACRSNCLKQLKEETWEKDQCNYCKGDPQCLDSCQKMLSGVKTCVDECYGAKDFDFCISKCAVQSNESGVKNEGTLCDSEFIQDKKKCLEQLSTAYAMAVKFEIPGDDAYLIIKQCSPCLITSLGKTEGEACQKANDLSNLNLKDSSVVTCKSLIDLMDKYFPDNY